MHHKAQTISLERINMINGGRQRFRFRFRFLFTAVTATVTVTATATVTVTVTVSNCVCDDRRWLRPSWTFATHTLRHTEGLCALCCLQSSVFSFWVSSHFRACGLSPARPTVKWPFKCFGCFSGQMKVNLCDLMRCCNVTLGLIGNQLGRAWGERGLCSSIRMRHVVAQA